jgi:ATP-binding cassette subfamily C (CFTR/MRP) protein 1
MLFVNTARALFTLAVVSTSTPAFIALIIPLSGVYYWVQRYYLRTSRELKRLDSISRSPIYAHFQESLGGITTIRAYRQQLRFAMENEWRVDANLRAYFPSINANRQVRHAKLCVQMWLTLSEMARCATRVPWLHYYLQCRGIRHYISFYG